MALRTGLATGVPIRKWDDNYGFGKHKAHCTREAQRASLAFTECDAPASEHQGCAFRFAATHAVRRESGRPALTHSERLLWSENKRFRARQYYRTANRAIVNFVATIFVMWIVGALLGRLSNVGKRTPSRR